MKHPFSKIQKSVSKHVIFFSFEGPSQLKNTEIRMTDKFVRGFNATLVLLRVIVGRVPVLTAGGGGTMGIAGALHTYQIGVYCIKDEILQPAYL